MMGRKVLDMGLQPEAASVQKLCGNLCIVTVVEMLAQARTARLLLTNRHR